MYDYANRLCQYTGICDVGQARARLQSGITTSERKGTDEEILEKLKAKNRFYEEIVEQS